MKEKKFKPNLKDTARRAKIVSHVKEFENFKNSSNKERIKGGLDAPVRIPITPNGKFRADNENHSKWGALDVGIIHLPDMVQDEFISFMVDKGHRVYDERDDISKDPKKQALGLRAGIVQIDDNVEEKVAYPEKNFVPQGFDPQAYDEEYGNGKPLGLPSPKPSSGGGSPSTYSNPGFGGNYNPTPDETPGPIQGPDPSPAGYDPGGGSVGPEYPGPGLFEEGGYDPGGGVPTPIGAGGGHPDPPPSPSAPHSPGGGPSPYPIAAPTPQPASGADPVDMTQEEIDKMRDQLALLESEPFKQQRQQMMRQKLQAEGVLKSQAEQAMRATQERNLRQMLAATKGGRGGGAARLRGLRRMAERTGEQTAQLGGLMRLKEKAMAEQALAGSISEMTGQALKDKWTEMGLDVQKEIAKINAEAAKYGANLRAQAAANQAQGQMVGGLLAGLGTIGAAFMMSGSDKNLKKNIKREDLYKDEFGDVYPGYESEKGDSKIHKPVNVTPQDLLKKKTKHKKSVKYEKGDSKEFKAHEMIDPSTKKKYWANTYKKHKKYEKKGYVHEKGDSEDFSPKKFLDALKPNSFEYKDKFKKNPMGGEDRYLGVMAQDLEKAGPVGKSMVKDTPMGKLVDYGKGFGAVLAAQAHLNQRLKALESKKKKRK